MYMYGFNAPPPPPAPPGAVGGVGRVHVVNGRMWVQFLLTISG